MADRYWVGGTSTWDATAGTKWALTSGGTGGEAVPTSSDAVFFDAASGAVTITGSVAKVCASIDFTGFTGTFGGSSTLTVSGSITLSATMTRTFSGTTTIDASGTVTTNGITYGDLTVNASGGTVTLGSNYTSTGNLTITAGTFDANDYNVSFSSTGGFTGSSSGTRTIRCGNGTWTFTGSATIGFTSSTNITWYYEGSSWIISGSTQSLFEIRTSASDSLQSLTLRGRSNLYCWLSGTPPTIVDLIVEGNVFLMNSRSNQSTDISYTITNLTIAPTSKMCFFMGYNAADSSDTVPINVSNTVSITNAAIQNVALSGSAATKIAEKSIDCGGNSGFDSFTPPSFGQTNPINGGIIYG